MKLLKFLNLQFQRHIFSGENLKAMTALILILLVHCIDTKHVLYNGYFMLLLFTFNYCTASNHMGCLAAKSGSNRQTVVTLLFFLRGLAFQIFMEFLQNFSNKKIYK